MKKKLIIMLSVAIACVGVAIATILIFGNKENLQEPIHVHEYNQQVATTKYKQSDATCIKKAVYYYSCVCEEKGITTFEYGEVLGHEFIEYLYNNDADCENDGTETATCNREECEEHDTRTKVGSALSHNYGEWVSNGNDAHTKICYNDNMHTITENCNGGQATCTSKAICKDCGEEYGDMLNHEYNMWKYTEEKHWQECECGEKTLCLSHDFENGMCECGFEEPEPEHVHSYKQLKYNENTHWYECECGEKENFENHNGGTATCTQKAVCLVCDQMYGSLKGHNYNILKYDVNNHWHECECGNKGEKLVHNGGTATCTKKAKCDICNQEYGDYKEHEFKIFKFNKEEHWYECVCGDKENMAKHVEGAPATEITDQVCTVCGYVIAPSLGHIHELHLTKIKEKENSCAEEGNIEYYICTCGKWFINHTATEEITNKESVVIEKLPHEYNEFKYNENKHWYECKCGDKDQEDIHNGGTATCTKKAVCVVCNQAYGMVLEHHHDKLKYDENGHWYECECGDKDQKSVHDGGTATCTEKAVCSLCGQQYGNTLPHSHTELKYNDNGHWYECECGDKDQIIVHDGGTATCTKKAVCSLCGQEYGNTLPHNHTELKYNDNGHWYECECGDKDQIIVHDGGTATCTEKAVCSLCGQEYGTVLVHEYKETNTDSEYLLSSATCQNKAVYYYSCQCGDKGKETFEYGDTVGHVYENDKCKWCKIKKTSEGLTYTLINNDTEYEVSGIGTCADTEIVIPSIYLGKPVTTVGSSAFQNNKKITSIIIPNSVISVKSYALYNCSSLTSVAIGSGVISIGSYAFKNCSSLKAVEIPNSVTNVDGGAFENCTSLKKVNYLGTIDSWAQIEFGHNFANPVYCAKNLYINDILVIEANITTATKISNYAFYYCTSLETVEIGNSVEDIGEDAFGNCGSLISVRIGDNVTSIGPESFYECRSLESVEIGNSVTSIGYSAFYSCSSLTKIVIPNSVTTIGSAAFCYCYSLESVVFPDSVTSVGKQLFYSCNSLMCKVEDGLKYIGNESNPYLYLVGAENSSITTANIHAGCRFIGYEAFYSCSSLTSVVIPDSVTSIDFYVFENCSSLQEITLPFVGKSKDGIEETYFGYLFGASSYSYNSSNVPTSLKKVTITSATSISSYAFYDCSSLESVNMENGVTSISSYAFSYCSSLKSVKIGNGVKVIGTNAFYDCFALETVEMGNSVENIGDGSFSGCSSLTSINIPNSATSIGECAFRYCNSLETIEIPNSVTSIGAGAFYGCDLLAYNVKEGLKYLGNESNLYLYFESVENSSITTATIDDNCKIIAADAFYSCSTLESVNIGNGVKVIGANAFYDCSSLTSVTIGGGVTSIDNYAFYYCNSIKKVNYLGTIDSWAQIEFGETAANPLIYAKNLYINDMLVTEANITIATKISNRAFYQCESLISVTIGNNVNSIGDFAFYGNSSLKSVTIGNKVTSVGDNAFSGCDSLTYNVKDGLKYLGNESNPYLYLADTENTTITTANIDSNCKIIGYRAFYDCSSLTSIIIPNGVTSIGASAFENCRSLESITIGNSVKYIGKDVFKYCYSLKKVNYLGTINSWVQIEFCNEYSNPTVYGKDIYINDVLVTEGNISTVTKISNYAFYNCRSLKSVTIGSSVTSIGDYAFSSCSSLTNIVIPNSVTSIGNYAFSSCSSLTSIVIPDSVTSIGQWAFRGSESLTSIIFNDTSIWYRTTKIDDYNNKVGGTVINVENSSTNASNLLYNYYMEYWYKI